LSSDPYSPLVRDYFAHTRHAGELADAVSVEHADQGVRIELRAKIEAGQFRAIRFRAWGCPHLIAACESFCAGYEGRAVRALSDFESSDIMRKMSVPVEKTGRILVLEDAVRLLGRAIRDASAPAQS
jgi:NifU-like protein involved in Fe-S cluster formation